MPSPGAAASANIQVTSVVPILRMYDVAATIRFYVDYLGCSLDWQAGDGDRPRALELRIDSSGACRCLLIARDCPSWSAASGTEVAHS